MVTYADETGNDIVTDNPVINADYQIFYDQGNYFGMQESITAIPNDVFINDIRSLKIRQKIY